MYTSPQRRTASWLAIAVSGGLVVLGLTHGAALPIVGATPPTGSYGGPPIGYAPVGRVVLPIGLKNAPLVGVSLGYVPPPTPTATPTPTPRPPTPTPSPPSPPRGPYGPPR
jgi:hypothetical protein